MITTVDRTVGAQLSTTDPGRVARQLRFMNKDNLTAHDDIASVNCWRSGLQSRLIMVCDPNRFFARESDRASHRNGACRCSSFARDIKTSAVYSMSPDSFAEAMALALPYPDARVCEATAITVQLSSRARSRRSSVS